MQIELGMLLKMTVTLHSAILVFVESVIESSFVTGKDVLEAGALNVNGSVRPQIEAMNPRSYIATDMRAGNGVDFVCKAEDLKPRSADVVFCLETLEHCQDWRAAALGLALATRNDGYLIVSAPAPGWAYHGFPYDFYRFSLEHLNDIFVALGFDVILCRDADGCSCAAGTKKRSPDVSALASIEVLQPFRHRYFT